MSQKYLALFCETVHRGLLRDSKLYLWLIRCLWRCQTGSGVGEKFKSQKIVCEETPPLDHSNNGWDPWEEWQSSISKGRLLHTRMMYWKDVKTSTHFCCQRKVKSISNINLCLKYKIFEWNIFASWKYWVNTRTAHALCSFKITSFDGLY